MWPSDCPDDTEYFQAVGSNPAAAKIFSSPVAFSVCNAAFTLVRFTQKAAAFIK